MTDVQMWADDLGIGLKIETGESSHITILPWDEIIAAFVNRHECADIRQNPLLPFPVATQQE